MDTANCRYNCNYNYNYIPTTTTVAAAIVDWIEMAMGEDRDSFGYGCCFDHNVDVDYQAVGQIEDEHKYETTSIR